jgi:hypothetical protein
MTYVLVIIVVGINATIPAITNIPGFKDKTSCVSEGKALSDAVASQGASDFGKVITFCVEVK